MHSLLQTSYNQLYCNTDRNTLYNIACGILVKIHVTTFNCILLTFSSWSIHNCCKPRTINYIAIQIKIHSSILHVVYWWKYMSLHCTFNTDTMECIWNLKAPQVVFVFIFVSYSNCIHNCKPHTLKYIACEIQKEIHSKHC